MGFRFRIAPYNSLKLISTINKIPANWRIKTSPYSKSGSGCKRKNKYKNNPTEILEIASRIIYISELLVCFLK